MEKSKSIGLTLRKGAWTYEEDKLLKACIEKYGDGKWHLVPQRAGLNRCRKSCRLRWLNYLNPTINRERFSEDEVDMILRLHKLLGNRWSLIAARLPGRTANDVKNYWNTHLLKKVVSNKEEEKKAANFPKESMKSHEIIKPRPITLSSRSPWLNGKHSFVEPIVEVLTKDGTFAKESVIESDILQINGEGDCALEDLLNASNEKIGACSLLQEERKSMLEFSNIDNLFIEGSSTISDLYWDSNFCEFDYLDIFN